jgi:hypothetical protein
VIAAALTVWLAFTVCQAADPDRCRRVELSVEDGQLAYVVQSPQVIAAYLANKPRWRLSPTGKIRCLPGRPA